LENLLRPLNASFFNLTERFENSENGESINEKNCDIKEIFESASENLNNLSDDEKVPESNFLNIEEILRAGYAFEIFKEAFEAGRVLEIIEEKFEYMRKSPRKPKST
jgi:hypothetical protein